ncbi:MAG: IS3 family transposase [Candidatus Thiodiazotropha sp. (ex Monitilora ramsayi)]|nr:IS3 family transposase [Candidatus Thiodiazotropha sp. (ex Monitilora ramsayi)]
MGRVSEGTKTERFGFIADHCSVFGVRYLCHQLGVSPQGYYKWVNRSKTPRDIENERIVRKIKEIFIEHDGNYGSPRIHAQLRRQGESINHKRVERLIREYGFVGKAGRIYRRKPLPENPCNKVQNIQREKGKPTKPNQQWAGDVTYLKVNGTWQYLAVILDLYSRKVVGWELSGSRTVALTLSALNKAVTSRRIGEELIFHSDRGSEYGANIYQSQLSKLGIKPSMNRPGCMNDNVYVESFFQTMKTECFKRVEFESVQELRMTLCWYMDEYYNCNRLHGSLGFKVPDEYERMAL